MLSAKPQWDFCMGIFHGPPLFLADVQTPLQYKQDMVHRLQRPSASELAFRQER